MRLKRVFACSLLTVLSVLLLNAGASEAYIIRMYDVAGIPELLRQIEVDDYQRASACVWLGRLGWGNEEVAHALGSMLANQDLEVRRAAVAAIGRLGPVALQYREEISRLQQGDVEVSFAASVSLCQLEDSSLPLAELRALPSDGHFRAEALEYLAWLGPRAVPALPLLRREMESEADYLKMQFARCLWRIDGDRDAAVRSCTEFINARGESQLVAAAIGILYEIDPGSAEPFLQLLPGLIRDDAACSTAMQVAVDLDYSTPEILEALLGQSANAEPWVRQEAAEDLIALIREPDERLARGILERLRSPVRDMIAVRYGGDKYSGLSELCGAYFKANSDWQNGSWDLVALLQVDDKDYCQDLLASIDGSAPLNEALLNRLLEFVNDPDQQLGLTASQALGRLGPVAAAAVPELRKLRDATPEIAWEVAQSIHEINLDEDELLAYAELHFADSSDLFGTATWSHSEPLLALCESRSAVPHRSRPVLLAELRRNPTALDPDWVRRLMLWGIQSEEYFPNGDFYLDWLKSQVEQEPKKYTMEGMEFANTRPRWAAFELIGTLASESPAAREYLLHIVQEDSGSDDSLARSCGAKLSNALALSGPKAAEAIPWLESELEADSQSASISAAAALIAIGGEKAKVMARLEYWTHRVEAEVPELWFDRTLQDWLGQDAARLLPILEQRWRWEKPWDEDEEEVRQELRQRLVK